jgi:hypothetical protein
MIYSNTKSKVKPKTMPKAEREAYAKWCARYDIKPEGKTKKKPTNMIKLPGTVYTPFIRETIRYPSLNTGHSGAVTTGVKKHTYTGDKMLGIAVMHKSNLVPIFTEENAAEVSKMRRG